MLGIEIRMEARPRKRAELLQALGSLAPPKAGPDRCTSHEVFEDLDRHDRFLWVERWPDAATLAARMESDAFRALMGAVKVLSEFSVMDVIEMPRSGPSRPRQGGFDHGEMET